MCFRVLPVVQRVLAVLFLAICCGCPGEEPARESDTDRPTAENGSENRVAAGWKFVTEKTSTGLTVVGNTVEQGGRQLMDSSSAAWIWSVDRSADGWTWIQENADDSTAWARSSASELWTVTRQESGQFTLWVQVEVADGVAWARTTIPETWRITRDAAGEAWVWIGEHRVEVAIAAAVVTVVVAALVTSPQVVATAAVRGAVVGGSQASVLFLSKAWTDSRERTDVQAFSENLFQSIGLSVLSQAGPQILSSFPGAETAAG